MHREPLNRVVSREFVRKLLDAGHAFDIGKGGHFDARGGCVNVWCTQDCKPACWNERIQPGAFPCDYVGAVSWEYRSESAWELFLEADPFALLDEHSDHFRKTRKRRRELPAGELEQVMAWLRGKAQELLNLADLAPKLAGTKCPLCDGYVLPPGGLLNGLVEHLHSAHAAAVKGVTLGERTVVDTVAGRFVLEDVESFAEPP